MNVVDFYRLKWIHKFAIKTRRVAASYCGKFESQGKFQTQMNCKKEKAEEEKGRILGGTAGICVTDAAESENVSISRRWLLGLRRRIPACVLLSLINR